MRCAVVDLKTGERVNVIMADPERDAPPDGCTLVALESEAPASDAVAAEAG